MIIHNKGKYVRHVAGVMLLPGTNNVSDEDWKKCSAHPIMQKVIEKGEVIAHEKAKSTKDFNVDGAVELINDTVSLDLLEEWQQADDRKGVQEAIADKLVELQGEGNDEE
ncbi:hypothetical protein AAV35_012710 [Salimicrobium jeotgali]|uniref:Uncharacterized protein n=1 Tax=Salimicrobium jeotgali TaxID=1230341 RepID=K2GJ37_9BACI|nr:hypothetical protein [Salimicrobium jeotgali]AKG05527.1 hypothetical protein AAV35_012710 [Salimicrobium jeotgali]EKE30484.1 hypothetical protein MJ3_13624 [Salimicrobium jeotgali]MBM7696632.1 hypothetical protein [Salimicrobium jeotgali]